MFRLQVLQCVHSHSRRIALELPTMAILLLTALLILDGTFLVTCQTKKPLPVTGVPLSTLSPVKMPSFSLAKSNITKKTRQDEVDILPQNYYRDVAPLGPNGKPVKVTVSIVMLNIKLSSGSSQTFDCDLFFHNYWTDHRLQKPSNEDAIAQRINLSPQESLPQYKLSDSWRKRLWVPDTYFRNGVDGKISNILSPTYYFTITNYTEVFMAVRLSLKLSCGMDFSKFPFDTQRCFINISMTSEDVNTVVLEWDMFRVGSHTDVTEFQVISVDKKNCVKYLDIGIFSCLYGEILFKRHIGTYLLRRFIPSFFIVVMTFIGFWIPTTVSPARTSLPITAILALITMQIQSDLDVSYVYAMQVWNLACVIFVFANLLEFAIAMYWMHMSQKKKGKKKRADDHGINGTVIHDRTITLSIADGDKSMHQTAPPPSRWRKSWRRLRYQLYKHFKTTNRNSAVDHFARILFPVAFFLFVFLFVLYVFYW